MGCEGYTQHTVSVSEGWGVCEKKHVIRFWVRVRLKDTSSGVRVQLKDMSAGLGCVFEKSMSQGWGACATKGMSSGLRRVFD